MSTKEEVTQYASMIVDVAKAGVGTMKARNVLSLVEAEMRSEMDRHLQAIVELLAKYPEYRSYLAHGLLGAAVGVCDTFGVDPEGFIRELRVKVPRPSVLVPPKDGQS